MFLASGATLGAYEIVASLGAGGMGEVYRARDTRLGRDVALKVTRYSGPDDAGSRARFEREARALAALNNPHIAAIYDVIALGDHQAIVMELVEGRTLADLIASGRNAIDLREDLTAPSGVAGQAALPPPTRGGRVVRTLTVTSRSRPGA